MISKTAIIHPNVILGENCVIEDFVIIGVPPKGYGVGDIETNIGDNAVIRFSYSHLCWEQNWY